MKLSAGLTKTLPSVLIFLFYDLSLSLLPLALKTMKVSVAYAIWSGIGTALMAIIGLTYFQENFDFLKWIGILLIISGVVLINLKGASH